MSEKLVGGFLCQNVVLHAHMFYSEPQHLDREKCCFKVELNHHEKALHDGFL